MNIFNRLFGKGASIDKEIKQACDSDILVNIVKVINDDKAKYQQVLDYLTEQDNISMMLRVMTLKIADRNAVMVYLMTLDPSYAPKINRLCKDGINPVIHFSMFKGMEVLIRVLAHAHADLDVVGFEGHTPLTIACENGYTETVKMLINNGAKAFEKCDASGWAPLHYACQLGNAEIVETLVKAGANVNIISNDKLMPIHLAISTAQTARTSPTSPNGIPWSVQGALKCFQILANNGADLDYICPYGFSGMSFLKKIGAVK